ncbi:hypothetical protein ADUPG1_004799, partial [Aduncisulcus paluster]
MVSLTHLSVGGNDSLVGDTDILPSMTNLIYLDGHGDGLTTVPDLSASHSSLISLNLGYNPSIFFAEPIVEYGLTNLSSLDISHCSLSDVSSLFFLEHLTTL